MVRLRAIAYPLRPFHVTSHHSPLQPVTRTVLPAGMVVTISESVPGPLRRLTVAATAADLARAVRAGAWEVGACVAGPSCGVALGTGSGPAAGGLCCACPVAAMAAAAMMLSAALSALKWKGMTKFSSPTTAPLLVNGQETPCKSHQRDQFAAEISILAHEENLTLRPRPLRRPHHFISMRHAQHARIVEAVADDLQSNRHSVRIVAGANRGGGLFRHVEWRREGDVLERGRRIIAGRRLLGRIGGDRRGRGNEEIGSLSRRHGVLARQHAEREVARPIDPTHFL